MINWPLAIERHRDALLRIVAALFALAGIGEGESKATLPRHLRNYVNRILRPAESAVRRLIVIAARGVEVAPPTLSPRGRESLFLHLRGQRPRKCLEKASEGVGMAKAVSAFPLLDPLKTFSLAPPKRRSKSFPRISVIGVTEPRPIPAGWIPLPDDDVSAVSLCHRLATLKRALDDLEGQARRFARWRARRAQNRTKRLSPMRPGWPPGRRKRPIHEIDDILKELHSLAVYAQREDTS